MDRKVWLPSGGTLVIDRTEAMTVVDVNTGKFTGSGGNLEETVTRNNLEAAEEIVRQLRLRDIGGIIVIDFIDMVLESNRDLVLRRLTECLARDRTRHQVAEVTSLGLVQMTRKRFGTGLIEAFSTPCEHCRGRGVIVATEPAAESNGRDRGERERNGDAGGGATAAATARRGERRSRRRRGRARRRRTRDPSGACGRRSSRPGHGRRRAGPRRGVRTTSEPVGAGPRTRPAWTSAHRTPVEPEPTASAVVPATVESVRDDVEEIVVEQALAVEREPARRRRTADRRRTPGRRCDERSRAEVVPHAHGVATDDAGRPGRRRRRGRVTRTAGAPTAATGDAPTVAVVTVPQRACRRASTTEEPGAGDVAAPPAAEPVVAPRARRVRRAASRPAGPPPRTPRTRPAPSRRARRHRSDRRPGRLPQRRRDDPV